MLVEMQQVNEGADLAIRKQNCAWCIVHILRSGRHLESGFSEARVEFREKYAMMRRVKALPR